MKELKKHHQVHTVKVNSITAHADCEHFQINCNIVLEGQLRQLNILLSEDMLDEVLSDSKIKNLKGENANRLSQVLSKKKKYSYLNTDRWFGKPMILENCILNLSNPLIRKKANYPIELIGMNSEK